MASVKTYMQQMYDRQRVIARKLGSDIGRTSKQTRVWNLAMLALLAVVVKALTDKGVVTDAELLAIMNAARDDDWDDEPTEPGT